MTITDATQTAPLRAMTPDEALRLAEEFGHGLLAARAEEIDRGARPVGENLRALAAVGLAGVTAPVALGGLGGDESLSLRVLEKLTYGDGTTPFVLAQHYGATGMIAASDNKTVRDALLPSLTRGEQWCGFGIAHVRRAGPPVLAATVLDGGARYRFDGTIPWMTGRGVFDHVIVAGTLPDGRALLALTSFADGPHLRIDPSMPLIAMNGAGTVSAVVEGLVVERSAVISIESSSRRAGANKTSASCLFGLTQASIDDLAALAERRSAPASAEAARRLDARLRQARMVFYDEVVGQPGGQPEAEGRLASSRADALALALDAVGALIVATGGSANGRAHPAQRRLRETSVFATWGLATTAINTEVTRLAGEAP